MSKKNAEAVQFENRNLREISFGATANPVEP